MAKKKQEIEDTPLVFDLSLSDTTLAGMVTRRRDEAIAHWNKEYNLEKIRDENKKLYTSEYLNSELLDDRYEKVFSDNKIFTAIRTILPFITSNMTQPDIVPSDDDSLSLQFSQDLQKILVEVAEDEYARDKIKLALQDLLMGQRVGIIKQVFDPDKKRLRFEHIDPKSVVIGKRSRLREEPDFIQHTQERTRGDLIRQFPDKKEAIYRQCGIEKGVPSQLEVPEKMTENWIWIEENGQSKLGVIFMLGDLLLGKMSDPNWMENGKNVVADHMSPFVFFNFLNDGSGYIDNTSFLEQAKYSQKQYDMRGKTIAENAAYAGTGVPVFGKGAIKEETAAKVKFNPINRVLLDTEDVTKSFTTWTAGTLPNYIFEDKRDMRDAVLDAFGTNTIQQGGGSDNKTLGQDVLLRNQAEGRQQELIDCLDNGMLRFYQLEAQLIYRYWDDEQYYNFIGEDGEFEHLVISQKRIADNLGIKIKIKTGSSLPVDRSQKIAQAKMLLENKRIGTLRLYKELGLEDPEGAYREYLQESLNPAGQLTDVNTDIFNREADEDLQLVIGGKEPKEREDIDEAYATHIQNYLMTQQYEQLGEKEQKRVTKFVAEVIAQLERKALKMATQQPLPSQEPPLMPIDPNAPQDGTMPPQGQEGAQAIPPAAPEQNAPATLPIQ